MDLKDIPGLSTFLEDTINGQLRAAVVNPNKISINLAEMMNAGDSSDRAIGIFKITLFDAKQLKNVDVTGMSDPCAIVHIGGKEVARTHVIDNSLAPVWNETFHIILYKSAFSQLANHSDELKIEVMHVNALQKKLIGATPTLRLQRWSRLLDPVSVDDLPDEISADLKKDQMRPMTRSEYDSLVANWGTPLCEPSEIIKQLSRPNHTDKRTGQIRFDMSYFPIPEVAPEVPLESRSGILSISVHQGKELASSKSACPDCAIEINGVSVARTSVKKHTNAPTWNFSCDSYCENVDMARVRFSVYDRGSKLGECTVDSKGLLNPEKDDWFKLYNAASGKLRITAKFIPVDMLHATTDTSMVKRKEPCALLRINVRKGEAIMNAEVLRKSDPYVKVNAGGKPFGATHVRQNTLDPEWNEIFYCIVSTPKDPLFFEVLDWNELRDDAKLGKVELRLDMLLPENPDLVDSKVDGKLAETVDALLADGFALTSKTATTVSVRAPLYISKSDEVPNSGGKKDSDDEESEADVPVATTTKSRLGPAAFFKKDMFKMPVLPTSTPRVRQHGHLHFDVEYFPVIRDLVIRPRPLNQAKKAATSARPSITAVKLETSAAEPVSDAAVIPSVDGDASAAVAKIAAEASAAVSESNAKDIPSGNASVTDEKELPISVIAQNVVDKHRSGVLRIRISSAKLSRPACTYIEIHVDGTAIFRTRVSEETMTPTWLEAADKFIIDMCTDSFVIILRQQIKDERSNNDFIIAQWQGNPVTELIGVSHDALVLRQYTSSGRPQDHMPYVARLKAEFWYAPVQIDMDVNSKFNSGVLNIDIIDAKNLASADRNGLSDPYCMISVNGEKLHKTKVQKGTLNPVFNEQVSVSIKSRLRSTVELQVMDWDAIGAHTYLGRVLIHLADLPVSEVLNKVYPLEDGKGAVTLRFFFIPQAINEKGSSLDAETRLESGSQSGVGKFYKGLTTSFANTAANTFMSGFGKKPQASGGGGAAKAGDLRYGLEGGRRREATGLGQPAMGSGSSEPAQNGLPRQLPVGPHGRRPGSPSNRPPGDVSIASAAASATDVAESARSSVSNLSKQAGAALQSGNQAVDGLSEKIDTLLSAESPSQFSAQLMSDASPTIMINGGSSSSQLHPSSADKFVGQATIEIVQGRGLSAMDSNGTSDPFVRVLQPLGVGGEFKVIHKTAVIKKNTSPVWTNEVMAVYFPPPTIRLVIKDHNTFKGSVDMGQIGLDLHGLFSTSNTFDEYFPVDGGQGELRVRGTLVPSGTDISDTVSMIEKKKSFFSFKKSSESISGMAHPNADHDVKRAPSSGLLAGFRRASGASMTAPPFLNKQSSAESIDGNLESKH
ncbi:hypothetical protein BASA83_005124 [Batrachochytrium salamandrivorans]|nr:hypothetical protein BASA83_005124 [Batrachochytrium salamandrivorans]